MSNSSPICQIIQFGLLPTSIGDSSSLLQSQTIYTGAVPQDGISKAYYFPELLSTISNTSATSASHYKEGTPRAANHNPSEHMKPLLGGRKPFHHVPRSNGNNDWNLSQHQQLAQYHCSQLGRNEQLPLPSYWSSQHTSNINILDTSRTWATSSSVLSKRPTTNNPSQSFFQPPPSSSTVLGKRHTPPPPLPSNADDMGPLCRLETDELLSLVQSMGTPEFLATSEKVFSSGNLHDPLHTTSAHVPVDGTSASSTPNLILGLGNGSGIDKGKSKEVSSYWDLDAMVEMLESMNKRQRKVTRQPVQDLALGSSDGKGASKNQINLSSGNCE
ncbi:hypothetical protein HU200_055687 [Digitaria exilis]|uniref:Uncharacterized protein n=1 Tax=Digitaria exilis TaxID=1010633 RepID=A0A835E4H0_9POAL|nr:hypothetical protein HU200_055687 [Digitaria exilis]